MELKLEVLRKLKLKLCSRQVASRFKSTRVINILGDNFYRQKTLCTNATLKFRLRRDLRRGCALLVIPDCSCAPPTQEIALPLFLSASSTFQNQSYVLR